MRQGFPTSDKWHHRTPVLERVGMNTGSPEMSQFTPEGAYPTALGGKGTQRQPMISLSGGNRTKFKVAKKERREPCREGTDVLQSGPLGALTGYEPVHM